MRRVGIFAALLTVSAATAHTAAALTFQPCGRPDGIVCATVTVPVARDGALPVSIDLYVEKEAAKSQPSQGALIALSGGPGESATFSTTSFASRLAPGLASHDLIVFDQRGTGSSGFLTCSASFINAGDWTSCANEVGPRRAYYATRDSVDDIEAVRQALGVNRISLFGISYGTKVALNYAQRYPTHVESLVLDSVVAPDGFDFYNRNNYSAIAPILHELCSAGCPGVPDPVGDLARLAAAAQNGFSVSAIVSNGSIATAKLPEAAFFRLFEYGMESEVFRSRFPGAVHAALAGDRFPLGRLWLEINAANTLGGQRSATGPQFEYSTVLNHATVCEDTAPPWFRQTPVSQRRQRLASELQAIGNAAFAPFDALAPSQSSPAAACLLWPLGLSAPVITGTMPDVPVLVLSGLVDDNTPPDDARKVAALFPHASLVLVPDSGHGVTHFRGASGGCVKERIAQFYAGQQVGSCPAIRPSIAVLPPPARSLAAVGPARHVAGKRGRTLAAVIETVNDAYYTTYTAGPYTGLRGGTFTVNADFSVLTLRRMSWVPGVVVSGVVDGTTGLGTFTVTGTGNHGTVVFGPKRAVTGTLDGKRVATSR